MYLYLFCTGTGMAQFNQSPTIHYQDGISQFSELQGRRDMLATMQLPAQFATVQTHLEGAREIAVTHHLEPHYHEYTQVTYFITHHTLIALIVHMPPQIHRPTGPLTK
jgi:hypothetical protein